MLGRLDAGPQGSNLRLAHLGMGAYSVSFVFTLISPVTSGFSTKTRALDGRQVLLQAEVLQSMASRAAIGMALVPSCTSRLEGP